MAETVRKLGYLLPNLGGAKEKKRRLLCSVAISKLMYGVTCWEKRMAEKGWAVLEKIRRRLALRTACGYNSVSEGAIGVIASIPPLKLQAREITRRSEARKENYEDGEMIGRWQEVWETDNKGRWTFEQIPNVKKWVGRKHGDINFHLTQFLTGHGSFGKYLHKIGKRQEDACQLCGVSPDTVKHAIFECDMWNKLRMEISTDIGKEIRAENFVELMLKSEYNWNRLDGAIRKIMKTRETVERDKERGQQT